MQDNFLPILQLKGVVSSSVIAVIQNGIRTQDSYSSFRDSKINQSQSKFRIDHYFCFDESMKNFLETQIQTAPTAIGSFRSNHSPRSRQTAEEVLVISTYRTDIDHNHVIGNSSDGRAVTYGELWNHRLRVIGDVGEMCRHKGLSLRILGKDKDFLAEQRYFRENLRQVNWELTPRTLERNSYQECDRASLVISTGSTLGLESLARGNRTAVFSTMSLLLTDHQYRFGWPENLEAEGPFWSESATTERISTILELLLRCDQSEWLEILERYKRVIPRYDPANSIFCERLKQFGAQSPYDRRSSAQIHCDQDE
jgi:surface carbohydrate biosynthesis protein